MKKLFLILLFSVSVLSGCAFLQDQKANFDACMADPVCKEQAKHYQDVTETASIVVASAIPVPGAAAAPKILGYIALGIAAILGGRTLRKSKANV